ncbi:AMP-binding protein [Aeromicrobium sp.]|uniref:AMP-binding protein n=1 Tax=Aeromicrobium sp. TaxID=1871063 RepID=UPI003C6936D5
MSLIFRVLDQHVIHGLADETAILDERGAMSYAELLHESASIAGALRNLGLAPGALLHLDLPDSRELTIALLASARIGVLPRAGADFQLSGSPPALRTPDTEVPWDLMIRAGRTDPAPAPDEDAEGYESLMRHAYADIFSILEAGGVIS